MAGTKSNYSTVRIDKDSKNKLDSLCDQIESQIGFDISLAKVLKLIIDEVHDNDLIIEIMNKRLKSHDN